jgi:hypothetical protein
LCYDRGGTSRHGLAGALDKALARRTCCSAPMPDRAALPERLRLEFVSCTGRWI